MVVVKKQNYADYGDIVVALIGNETTLKTYYPEPEKKRIRLHPENSDMKDIIVRECNIQGVAKHVINNINSGKMIFRTYIALKFQKDTEMFFCICIRSSKEGHTIIL